jgi:hypothetical protein
MREDLLMDVRAIKFGASQALQALRSRDWSLLDRSSGDDGMERWQ